MWIYKGSEINNKEDLPLEDRESFGFIYVIRNFTTNLDYYGRKQLFHRRKVKKGKKEITRMEDRRGSIYKIVTKESNWVNYTGSNKLLNEHIQRGDNIEKEILYFCNSKAQMTYFETKIQFLEEVLERPSYNDNILGKFYRKIFDETK